MREDRIKLHYKTTLYSIQYHLPIVLVCFGPRGILSDPPPDHPLCRLPIALSVPSTIADGCGDTSESPVLRLVRTGTTYGGRDGKREGGKEGEWKEGGREGGREGGGKEGRKGGREGGRGINRDILIVGNVNYNNTLHHTYIIHEQVTVHNHQMKCIIYIWTILQYHYSMLH